PHGLGMTRRPLLGAAERLARGVLYNVRGISGTSRLAGTDPPLSAVLANAERTLAPDMRSAGFGPIARPTASATPAPQ
ncbi:MAG TPA: hypothetical protein VFX31_05720, partial [Ktedonobacterales bacterium]|nr:hypothetical protein [Ktedonobacterales bacterium]